MPANGTDRLDGNPKRGINVWRVVFVVALIVFIGSLCALGAIAFSYIQGQQKYDHIVDTAGFEVPATDTDDDGADIDMAKLTVDWDALLAVNPDTVGWVYIPNTPVNYPIVQGPDNEYYLTHDFDGASGWIAEFGSVFLEASNKRDWSDACSFVFGHHLNDGSMFAVIGNISNPAQFAECSTAYILTPRGNMKLKALSLVHCSAYEEIVKVSFGSPEEFAEYVKSLMDRSEYAVEGAPNVEQITKVIALATCDSTYESSGRNIMLYNVVEASGDDLVGTIGIATDENGNAEGLANDIEIQSSES